MPALTLSIAFVLQTTVRISATKAGNGTNSAHAWLPQSDDRRIPSAPRCDELSEPGSGGSERGCFEPVGLAGMTRRAWFRGVPRSGAAWIAGVSQRRRAGSTLARALSAANARTSSARPQAAMLRAERTILMLAVAESSLERSRVPSAYG